MQPESAETLALQALAWVVSNEELLPVFMGSSGASAEDLKARATDPHFLASVLDFLTMDDAWVVSFCDASGHDYSAPLTARAYLPGGNLPNWT